MEIMDSDCLNAFIDNGTQESHRYYLARQTIHEMLHDRGYNVPESELNLSLHQFRSNFTHTPDLESLTISYPLLSDPNKKIKVVFCGPEKLNKKGVESVFKRIENSKEKLNRLMLIVENAVTAQATQYLKLCSVKHEVFQITDLLFNITKHILMPKHEILSSDEKKILLDKYNVKDNQIPRMLETDAIARYYGLEKGQVVKVTTESDVADSHMTYRCVV